MARWTGSVADALFFAVDGGAGQFAFAGVAGGGTVLIAGLSTQHGSRGPCGRNLILTTRHRRPYRPDRLRIRHILAAGRGDGSLVQSHKLLRPYRTDDAIDRMIADDRNEAGNQPHSKALGEFRILLHIDLTDRHPASNQIGDDRLHLATGTTIGPGKLQDFGGLNGGNEDEYDQGDKSVHKCPSLDCEDDRSIDRGKARRVKWADCARIPAGRQAQSDRPRRRPGCFQDRISKPWRTLRADRLSAK